MSTAPSVEFSGARALAIFDDSITTDHISPAGAIKATSSAGDYLRDRGVADGDFNSYGARRGNHEVMVRGTFANVRIRNLMVPGVEGGITCHQPDGERMGIYDAAERYRAEDVPLIVIAGLDYGAGSSRDWAAKGTRLLGVRAVVARGFERIHRSNLIGMGVLPCELPEGVSAQTLGLDGTERFDLVTGEPPRPRQPATPAHRTPRRSPRVNTAPAADRYADRGRLLSGRRHHAVCARTARAAAGVAADYLTETNDGPDLPSRFRRWIVDFERACNGSGQLAHHRLPGSWRSRPDCHPTSRCSVPGQRQRHRHASTGTSPGTFRFDGTAV